MEDHRIGLIHFVAPRVAALDFGVALTSSVLLTLLGIARVGEVQKDLSSAVDVAVQSFANRGATQVVRSMTKNAG